MTPGRKRNKKNKKPNSESSTPQSSVPSVEDEEQQLLQGGARGSSHNRESRGRKNSPKKRTPPEQKSPNQSLGATASENLQSNPLTAKIHLTIPDTESSTILQSSPSKKSLLTQLKHTFSPKKRSPRKSDLEYGSGTDRRGECPEKNKSPADAKRQSLEGAHESKISSSNVSPVLLKKNVESGQSSSGSDPGVKECSNNATQPEQTSDKNRLSVPEQEKVEASQSSPLKKSLYAEFKRKMSPKKRSTYRSIDSECSCVDRNDHNPECPERKRSCDTKKKSSKDSKSYTSSSSASPVLKKAQTGNSSNTSSDNSRQSYSKSSSASEANVKECLCPDKKRHSLECSSGNKNSNKSKSSTQSSCRNDDDPLEGTSSDSTEHAHTRFNIEDVYDLMRRNFKRFHIKKNTENPSEAGELAGEELVPIIDNMDDVSSGELEDEEKVEEIRKRSKSFASNMRVKVKNKSSKPKRSSKAKLECHDNQIDNEAAFLDPPVEWENPGVRDDGSNTDTKPGFESYWSDPFVRKDSRIGRQDVDNKEKDIKSGAESEWLDKSVGKKDLRVSQDRDCDTNTQMTGAETGGSDLFLKMKGPKDHKDDGSGTQTCLDPSVKRKNLGVGRNDGSDTDTQRGTESGWSDTSVRRKDSKARRDWDRGTNSRRRAAEMGGSDSSLGRSGRRIHRDDGSDTDTQRDTESGWSDTSVRRKDSKARRDFDRGTNIQRRAAEMGGSDSSLGRRGRRIHRDDGSDGNFQIRAADMGWSDSSVRQNLSDRGDDGGHSNIERRDSATRPDSLGVETLRSEHNAEGNAFASATLGTTTASVRRHQSLSPYPLDGCRCKNQYIHSIGCSREIRARQRRKKRRCKQDVQKVNKD